MMANNKTSKLKEKRNNVMKTKTEITTQYAPFALTSSGKWRKLVPFFCRSQESAEKDLQLYKEHPFVDRYKDYKVMKRTAITTISEWEDIDPIRKD